MAEIHRRRFPHRDRLRRGRGQLARRSRGARQPHLPQPRRAPEADHPQARRSIQREGLRRHQGRQRERRGRSGGHHLPLLRRPRRRPQRLRRRHLGLGLLQRPERPGDGRFRVRPRERPDGAGGRRDRQRRGVGRDLPPMHGPADQGGRRGARPHRRPRPGVALRRGHRRRRGRLDHRRPRLFDLHARGGRASLGEGRGDGRVLQRLQLHRPPGRDVPPARAPRERPGLEHAGARCRTGIGRDRQRPDEHLPRPLGLHLLGHAQRVLGGHRGRHHLGIHAHGRRRDGARAGVWQGGGEEGTDRAAAQQRRGDPGRAQDGVGRRGQPEPAERVGREGPAGTSSTATGVPTSSRR